MLPGKVARIASLLGLAGLGGVAACASESPSESTTNCSQVVWHKPVRANAYVEIIGDWNNWARPGIVPATRDDGFRVAEVPLSAGEHKYAILEDGQWLVDQHVATTAFHEGREVTLLDDVKCGAGVNVVGLHADATSATLEAQLVGTEAEGVSITIERAVREGDTGAPAADVAPLALGTMTPGGDRFVGVVPNLPRGRHELMLRARRGDSVLAETRTSVWVSPLATSKRDFIVYQAIVDRFRASDGSALAAPLQGAARAGGTLAGLRSFVESGELTALGFNALWVSPLYENPEGMWPGGGHEYSSYHGYWPVNARKVDARLGGDEALDALIRAAHDRGVAVIVDVVPNHVHQNHEYASRPGFVKTDASCMCGQPGCDWARHINDCWFAPYLPDLNWENDDVARTVTSDVRWWFDRFGIDGIRIDAVPMMPRAATRRMASTVRSRARVPEGDLARVEVPLLLGENFTGPGGYGSLKYHLGPQGLDSQFHFPLMWAIRGAVAQENMPLSNVADAVLRGDEEWTGSGAIMATMIGNHDVTRFSSVSDGTANGDGWTPAPMPKTAEVYAKQKLGLSMLYTLPGMPTVYYGDEIALAGGGDPDSRRVMPSSASWSALERDVATHTAALGRARACSTALRRGETTVLASGLEHVVLLRKSGGDVAIVVWTRRQATPVTVEIQEILQGTYIDLLSGIEASLTPELTLPPGPPFSAHIFVPKGSGCAP